MKLAYYSYPLQRIKKIILVSPFNEEKCGTEIWPVVHSQGKTQTNNIRNITQF